MSTSHRIAQTSLPIITGTQQDAASAFLGPTPDHVTAGMNFLGDISASDDARMILGNVSTTITGPVNRIELHVTDTVSNNLGLLSTGSSEVETIYDQLTEILQSNYEDLSMTMLDEPHEGTCSWILAHDAYVEWKDDPSGDFLWLCGAPGCGKTTLSLFLLRHWEEMVPATHKVAHFFFSRQLEKAKTPENFLSSLLFQILQLYPMTRDLLKQLSGLKATQSLASLTSTYESLWNILTQILSALQSSTATQAHKPLICIIDALEECADTANMQFLRRLNRALRVSPFPIKVLVTCRRDFIERLSPALTTCHVINVDEENLADIYSFVTDHMHTLSQNPVDADISSVLEMEIVARSDGIFLWAALVVEGLLRRGTRLSTVLKTIHAFPKGRDEKLRKLYEEILRQASDDLKDEQLIDDINSILSIVITAASPLTLQELQGCLEAEAMESLHLDLEHDIRSTCCGLLKIDDDFVRPFHITMKAYLEDATECLPQFHIGKDQRHVRLARSCLRYASDRLELISLDRNEELETALAENAFLEYATTQWLYHLVGTDTIHEDLIDSIHTLLGTTASFQKWVAIVVHCESELRQQLRLFRTLCGETTDFLSMQLKPAHILSLVGLSRPLFSAIFRSHTNSVFSENALSPENVDGRGRTPAHWAAGFTMRALDPAYSRAEQLNLLLLHSTKNIQATTSADVLSHILRIFPSSSNICDESGMTPLHVACSGGSIQEIKILLDSKADVQIQDSNGHSPLHYCCGPIDTDNAKIVVLYGADPNVKSKHGVTPLHIAALHGQEQTIKLLIEKGARVDMEDVVGMIPLHWAVTYGDNYAQLVISNMLENELLVSQETDLLEYLPSFFGSMTARDQAIKRLIAAGSNLEHRMGNGNTPLLIAASEGHLQIVKILESAKANLDAKNNLGCT